MTELEATLNVPKEVKISMEINGQMTEETVLLRQVKMKQLSELMKIVGPITKLMKDPANFKPEAVFSEYPETVMDIIRIGTGRPKEWVENLEIPDALNLFSGLLEVNLDFFIRNILPSLRASVIQLSSLTAVKQILAGKMPSTSSSQPATATPTTSPS